MKKTDIEIVWNGERNEEGIHARTIHLHPRQVGGAILSLDKMIPDEAWLWAGTSWKKDINKSLDKNRLIIIFMMLVMIYLKN